MRSRSKASQSTAEARGGQPGARPARGDPQPFAQRLAEVLLPSGPALEARAVAGPLGLAPSHVADPCAVLS